MTDLSANLPGARRGLPAAAQRHSRRFAGLRRLWVKAGWPIRLCMATLLGLIAVAVLAPLFAPFDPNAQSLLARLRPPAGFDRAMAAHPLGTDQLGRDILSRSLFGLRLTLAIATLGSLLSLVLGTTLGILAGYLRGRTGALIMALVNVQIAVPFTLIALLVIAVFGTSLPVLIAVIGLSGWEHYARVVRAQVLSISRMPFIEAATAAGASHARILWRHVLPNLASLLIVLWTMTFSSLILLESTLSFLGLGVQPPTATLGSMVGLGRDYLASAPWIALLPAMGIMLVSLLVLLIGDWLRDALDVKLK